MMVAPASLSSRRSSTMDAPDRESRLPVGSSASSRAGWPMMARAIATRWRSPPDIWWGLWSMRCPSPTRVRASRAASRRLARGTPRYSSPSATLSKADTPAVRWNCWNTKPISDERTPDSSVSRREDTSVPSMRTLPEVGRSSVPIRLSRVDFPEPDGPTMATNSPSSTARDTPLQACTGGEPNDRCTSVSSRMWLIGWAPPRAGLR